MKEKLEALAKGLKAGMFADRKTIDEAYKYATSIAKACGDDEIAVLTAIHVLMNTISNEIIGISKMK